MTPNSIRKAVERVKARLEAPYDLGIYGIEADLRLILSAIPAPVGGDRERPTSVKQAVQMMYAEYMKDEHCDDAVIYGLIEVAHDLLSAIPAAADKERIARIVENAISDAFSCAIPESWEVARKFAGDAADAILALSAPGGALQSEREGR